jgi:hypothetical protein
MHALMPFVATFVARNQIGSAFHTCVAAMLGLFVLGLPLAMVNNRLRKLNSHKTICQKGPCQQYLTCLVFDVSQMCIEPGQCY